MIRHLQKELSYVSYQPSDDVDVNPWTVDGFHPDPIQVYSQTWMVQTAPDESKVGEVFVYGDRPMKLVTDTTRRAIGAHNPLTGEVRFHPLTRAKFGWDELATHRLGTYRETGLAMENTRLAHAMQDRSARAPFHDVTAKWRENHGNPNAQTQFKWPKIGYLRPR